MTRETPPTCFPGDTAFTPHLGPSSRRKQVPGRPTRRVRAVVLRCSIKRETRGPRSASGAPSPGPAPRGAPGNGNSPPLPARVSANASAKTRELCGWREPQGEAKTQSQGVCQRSGRPFCKQKPSRQVPSAPGGREPRRTPTRALPRTAVPRTAVGRDGSPPVSVPRQVVRTKVPDCARPLRSPCRDETSPTGAPSRPGPTSPSRSLTQSELSRNNDNAITAACGPGWQSCACCPQKLTHRPSESLRGPI